MTLEAFKQALTNKDWQLAYARLHQATLVENDSNIHAYLSSNAVDILTAVIDCYSQHVVATTNLSADQNFGVPSVFNLDNRDETRVKSFTNEPIVSFIELLICKGLDFDTLIAEGKTAREKLRDISPDLDEHIKSCIARLDTAQKELPAKLTLFAYTMAVVAAPALTQAKSLWQVLDTYGFKDPKQKQAIEYLMITTGIEDASEFLRNETTNSDELFSRIVKFVELTQQNFTVRTGNQERWDVKTKEWMENKAEQDKIIDALRSLNLLDKVEPKFSKRKAICILGGRKRNMDLRMQFAQEALPTEFIIILAGERFVTINKDGISIDGTREELETYAKKINKKLEELTETDLARETFANSSFNTKLPCVVIDTPRGNLPRPTTETTMLELTKWLKTYQQSLADDVELTFVSSQPHVGYQAAVIAEVLKHEGISLQYEVVGPAFDYEYKDPAQVIKESIGALGSQIYAATPSIVEDLNLDISDSALKDQFAQIYANQQLILQPRAKNVVKLSPA